MFQQTNTYNNIQSVFAISCFFPDILIINRWIIIVTFTKFNEFDRISIDVFPIIFDARGLRPDMLRFPRFSLWIYVVILWRHSPSVNVITQTQGKRSMSGLSPLASNIIGKTSIACQFYWMNSIYILDWKLTPVYNGKTPSVPWVSIIYRFHCHWMLTGYNYIAYLPALCR